MNPGIAAEASRCGAEAHWLDESGVRTDCTAGTRYRPRDRTPTARVSGRPARVHVLGTPTSAGVLRFGVSAGRFTAPVFIAFLARPLRSTTGVVFLVVDGHPVHRRRKAREWATAQGGRLLLSFLPPYCPELNPTEYRNHAVTGGVPRVRRPRDKGAVGGPGAAVAAGHPGPSVARPAVLPIRARPLYRLTRRRSFPARGNECRRVLKWAVGVPDHSEQFPVRIPCDGTVALNRFATARKERAECNLPIECGQSDVHLEHPPRSYDWVTSIHEVACRSPGRVVLGRHPQPVRRRLSHPSPGRVVPVPARSRRSWPGAVDDTRARSRLAACQSPQWHPVVLNRIYKLLLYMELSHDHSTNAGWPSSEEDGRGSLVNLEVTICNQESTYGYSGMAAPIL